MIKRQGFTLIEILIVVAIIAILASVVLIGLGPTQQSGRDARRLSDLHEVQNGLELFFNKCGYYPGTAAGGACAAGGATAGYAEMSGALTGAGLGINSVPSDPLNNATYKYYYKTNGADANSYLLAATLENKSNSVFAGYNPPGGTYGSGDTLPGACATTGDANGTGLYCLTL